MTKERIDKFVEELKKEGHIALTGEFTITFDYIKEGTTSIPCNEGMGITMWPVGRDGSGISLKIDPYDDQIGSGIALTAEQNSFIDVEEMKYIPINDRFEILDL